MSRSAFRGGGGESTTTSTEIKSGCTSALINRKIVKFLVVSRIELEGRGGRRVEDAFSFLSFVDAHAAGWHAKGVMA